MAKKLDGKRFLKNVYSSKKLTSSKTPKNVKINSNLIISQKAHDDLVTHLIDRLIFAKPIHDEQVEKYRKIDKNIYGYLKLDADDQKRESDNQKGYGIKPTESIMPLTLTQIDEAITYFIEVLSTDSGLYGAIAPKDKQKIANGFASVMNEHAVKFQHIRHLNIFLFNCLKYNLGGITTEWTKIYGKKLTNTEIGSVKSEDTVVYEGNNLEYIDNYNFYYDVSQSPIDLAMKGEFFATVGVHTPFTAQRMLENEEIFNLEDIITKSNYTVKYYEEKPTIRGDIASSEKFSWLNILGGSDNTSISGSVIEFVKFYIWLDLKKFGIDKNAEKMQICRVVLANSERIVKLEIMENAHGYLPIGISMPNEDGFELSTKSFAELLSAYQNFASAQMNTHVKANRKALYGQTFYNKNVVNLDDQYDPIACKVPINADPNVDIRKAIHQIYDAPGTEQTMQTIDGVIQLMQKILPTDMLRQVASLERATQYQASATVQGANRRDLKIAKIIDIQALSPIRNMEMLNIFQYQKSIEVLTQEGDLIEVNPTEFRETKIEFAISDGLRGLDRLTIATNMKEILNTIVQSQSASQQVDVVEVLNYVSSLLGDKSDMTQFRLKSAIDALPLEQKNLAYQLLQQFVESQKGGGTQQT